MQEGLFLVSVVVVEGDPEVLRNALTKIEAATKKGRLKWAGNRDGVQHEYIQRILDLPELHDSLMYSRFPQAVNYLQLTILTTAKAILAKTRARTEYRAIVWVDGLPKSKVKWFSAELRKLFIRTEKVRGVRKEESDALMRLADAIAGFAKDALSGNRPDLAALFKHAKKTGYLREV